MTDDANLEKIRENIHAIDLKLVAHDGKFLLLQWMVGIVFAGVASLVAGMVSLLIKTYFP